MGNRARVVVFYGICYGWADESADAARFWESGRDPGPHESDPMALVYYGKPADGVEAVAYGHYDFRRYALAVAGTVGKGGEWEEVPLPAADAVPDERVAELRDYCGRHGLTWRQPRWWVVPDYG